MRSAADAGTPRAIATLIHVQILPKLMKLSQGDILLALYIWAAVSNKSGIQPCSTHVIPMVTAIVERAQGEHDSSNRCWRLTQGTKASWVAAARAFISRWSVTNPER